jgi:hypothetical protein
MLWAGFEPTTPALERAKTVHALDREASVIGMYTVRSSQNFRPTVPIFTSKWRVV